MSIFNSIFNYIYDIVYSIYYISAPNPLNKLPHDINRIVYRYIYDSVLSQFKHLYGRMWLKQVSSTDCCERINNDIMRIYNNFRFEDIEETLFKFMKSNNGDPSNALPMFRQSDLSKYKYYPHSMLCNAS